MLLAEKTNSNIKKKRALVVSNIFAYGRSVCLLIFFCVLLLPIPRLLLNKYARVKTVLGSFNIRTHAHERRQINKNLASRL